MDFKNLTVKKFSFNSVQADLKKYLVENVGRFTFVGALRCCGITSQQYVRLESSAVEDEVKTYALLSAYRQALAEVLEAKLFYQGEKFYNYNNAQWLLKKLVPEIYGDKIQMVQSKTNAVLETISLENESGFSLVNAKNS